MALNPYAVGVIKLEYGTPGAGGALPTTWKDVGCIVEGTLGMAMADGTPIDIYCTGHVLAFHKDVEKTVTITGTVNGVNRDVMKDFWGLDAPDSNQIEWVTTTITNLVYAFRMSAPDVIGSDRLNIPAGAMNLGIGFADNAGYTFPFTITLTMGEFGKLFGWDVVPDPGA